MTGKISRIRPAVGKSALLFLAAFMWIGVGSMLLALAYGWLHNAPGPGVIMPVALGAAAALVIHHFGFLKIVDKNLARILPMEGKRCLFAFMTWKSYLNVAAMIALGILLRHSAIPKPYLAVLYIGIGLALVLSSVRYLRILLRHQ
ncbi:MAG: hypothetical protein WAU91_00345 [Desulfatitalea sp.]